LKPGDVLTVWKLDRRSRSLRDLLFTLETITAAGAGFRSITEAIDTTTAPGRLMTWTWSSTMISRLPGEEARRLAR